MDQCSTKRINRKGIQIVVVQKENCYDLFVDITPEADLSKKTVEKDYYTLKLRLLDGRKELDEALHLEISNKKYKDNEIAHYSKIIVKDKKYRFEISLAPTLYVLPSKLAEATLKRRNKNPKPKKKISTQGLKMPGLAAPKMTKYTQSNVSRPYNGGRCSPK